MSLLHKALKKAEKEQGDPTGATPLIDRGEAPKSSSLKVVFLLVLIAASLGAVAWFRVFKKPSEDVALAPKNFSTPLQIAGGPSSPQMADDAIRAIQNGRYEEAQELLEKVTLLEPRNPEAYNNLGYVLKKLGRNEEAFEQYRKALSLDPNCTECLNNLGVLYMANRNLTEAELQLKKAIELKPDYPDPYFHLGLLLEAQGNLAEAKRQYLKYIDLAKGVSSDLVLKIQQRIGSLETP